MKKSTMYKQGNGWIVSSWDAGYHCYQLSNEMPYQRARQAVGEDNCPFNEGKTCTCKTHQHEEKP